MCKRGLSEYSGLTWIIRQDGEKMKLYKKEFRVRTLLQYLLLVSAHGGWVCRTMNIICVPRHACALWVIAFSVAALLFHRLTGHIKQAVDHVDIVILCLQLPAVLHSAPEDAYCRRRICVARCSEILPLKTPTTKHKPKPQMMVSLDPTNLRKTRGVNALLLLFFLITLQGLMAKTGINHEVSRADSVFLRVPSPAVFWFIVTLAICWMLVNTPVCTKSCGSWEMMTGAESDVHYLTLHTPMCIAWCSFKMID